MLVTDPRYGDARILEVARACANVEGFAVQLRDRTPRSDDDLLPLATELRAIVPTLIINRRIDLARRVRADGVHGEDLPPKDAKDFEWRSSPAHDAQQLQNARNAGATAVLVSPIFASPEKGAPRGVSALREARAMAPAMTIVALGGIDETNARACREAGADAVAVIRAIFDCRDPAALAARLL
jgi:thiamine-phosphate pyrophosphorylase